MLKKFKLSYQFVFKYFKESSKISVLHWNMTQVCYLIHSAKSTSNAETVVNFSPSLTHMSKHGNCTARERKDNEWKEGRMTDEQMHEQPEITGIYLLADREIERIEGKEQRRMRGKEK